MKHHEIEYVELKTLIANMSTRVTEMIEQAVKALMTRNDQLAEQVIQKDQLVDELDVEIDTLCMKILALYEPKAVDLRYILTASRIIVDLERIGDHSCNISREILKLNQGPQLKPYVDLPKMAQLAIDMIKDAVNAYFEKDTSSAGNVIERDSAVNQLHGSVLHDLMSYIDHEKFSTESAIRLMFIARNIERMADHAKNIAELVYFMVTGKIIRHSYKSNFESAD